MRTPIVKQKAERQDPTESSPPGNILKPKASRALSSTMMVGNEHYAQS